MEDRNLIFEIISIPIKFRLGSKSFSALLKDIGYEKNKNDVTEKDIVDILSEHPGYIQEWSVWSDDKRVDKGWYLKDNVVGHYPESADIPIIRYANEIDACAAFIKRELDSAVERMK